MAADDPTSLAMVDLQSMLQHTMFGVQVTMARLVWRLFNISYKLAVRSIRPTWVAWLLSTRHQDCPVLSWWGYCWTGKQILRVGLWPGQGGAPGTCPSSAGAAVWSPGPWPTRWTGERTSTSQSWWEFTLRSRWSEPFHHFIENFNWSNICSS